MLVKMLIIYLCLTGIAVINFIISNEVTSIRIFDVKLFTREYEPEMTVATLPSASFTRRMAAPTIIDTLGCIYISRVLFANTHMS